MTLKQAERITQLTITKREAGKRISLFGVDDTMTVLVTATAHTEKIAAALLVEKNYTRVGDIIVRMQGFRCAKCGQRKPLSRHHKKLRSHGRVDSVENIEWLCEGCHAEQHGAKKGK